MKLPCVPLFSKLTLALAASVTLFCACSTLDGFFGVEKSTPPGKQENVAVETIQQVGSLFGPLGLALSSLVVAAGNVYWTWRRSKKGDSDHAENVAAIARIEERLTVRE